MRHVRKQKPLRVHFTCFGAKEKGSRCTEDATTSRGNGAAVALTGK